MPFFLSLFITDAAIIIKCGHTLGEWDAFEGVKVIGCSEGAATMARILPNGVLPFPGSPRSHRA
jgi:hypothetical protein